MCLWRLGRVALGGGRVACDGNGYKCYRVWTRTLSHVYIRQDLCRIELKRVIDSAWRHDETLLPSERLRWEKGLQRNMTVTAEFELRVGIQQQLPPTEGGTGGMLNSSVRDNKSEGNCVLKAWGRLLSHLNQEVLVRVEPRGKGQEIPRIRTFSCSGHSYLSFLHRRECPNSSVEFRATEKRGALLKHSNL